MEGYLGRSLSDALDCITDDSYWNGNDFNVRYEWGSLHWLERGGEYQLVWSILRQREQLDNIGSCEEWSTRGWAKGCDAKSAIDLGADFDSCYIYQYATGKCFHPSQALGSMKNTRWSYNINNWPVLWCGMMHLHRLLIGFCDWFIWHLIGNNILTVKSLWVLLWRMEFLASPCRHNTT